MWKRIEETDGQITEVQELSTGCLVRSSVRGGFAMAFAPGARLADFTPAQAPNPTEPRPGVWYPVLDYATASKFVGKTVRRCYGILSTDHRKWRVAKCENMGPGWFVRDEQGGCFAMGGRPDDTYSDTVYLMVVPHG